MIAKIAFVCFVPMSGGFGVTSQAFRAAQATAVDRFVIWNVGQGLWTTFIEKDRCIHIDMGGERAPWKEVVQSCARKINLVYFTHLDRDHTNFSRLAIRQLPKICFIMTDQIIGLPPCTPENHHSLAHLIEKLEPSQSRTNGIHGHKHTKDRNFRSEIFKVASRIIVPGDSPARAEKAWAPKLGKLNRIEVLVLGHHGSKTSTSPQLLSHLRNLRFAIASARYAKYGHPHRDVSARLLARNGLRPLTTEAWGHLILEMGAP